MTVFRQSSLFTTCFETAGVFLRESKFPVRQINCSCQKVICPYVKSVLNCHSVIESLCIQRLKGRFAYLFSFLCFVLCGVLLFLIIHWFSTHTTFKGYWLVKIKPYRAWSIAILVVFLLYCLPDNFVMIYADREICFGLLKDVIQWGQRRTHFFHFLLYSSYHTHPNLLATIQR